jgi:ABC-2 type transport system ATP-binding protein
LVEIRDLIKKFGKEKTVLFSTHIMQEVEALCDRVIVMNKGQVVANESLENLQGKKEQIIEVEFDVKVEKEFLEQITGIQSLENIYDTTWQLYFDNSRDVRSRVFDFAHDNGLKILNLTRKNKGLEQLFKELTKS